MKIYLVSIVILIIIIYYLFFNHHYESFKNTDCYLPELLEIAMKDTNVNENDYFIPCEYDTCENKIKEFENEIESRKLFLIDGCDILGSKLVLWEILATTYGSDANNHMPTTFLLHDEKSMSNFSDHFNKKQKEKKNHMFVLKNYAQRQEGIKLCNELDVILNAKNNGYYLVQDYLYKPYLIDNRKVNFRYYTLIICKNGIVDCYIHRNGFVYYTPDYYDENEMDFNKHITTGYIDRKVYEKNPLTLEDFRNYLDKIKEGDSKIWDSNVSELMNNVMKALAPHICTNKKLSHQTKFQLFGSDIAITDNLDAYLMEINKGPDLDAKDERDRNVKLSMQRDIFKLIENNNVSNNLFEKIY